eukprot:6478845-Amphidinium_carterae.1
MAQEPQLKVTTTDQMLALRLAMQHEEFPQFPQLSPFERLHEIQMHIQDVATRYKVVDKPPIKPWVSSSTWSALQNLNKHRKQVATLARELRRDMARHGFSALAGRQGTPRQLVMKELRLTALTVHTRVTAKRVKKRLRVDKQEWLHQVCLEVQSAKNDNDAKKFYKLLRRYFSGSEKSHVQVRLRPLLNEKGITACTPEQKNIMWQDHWSSMYGATVESNQRDFTMWQDSDGQDIVAHPAAIPENSWFTRAEVGRAVIHLCADKASPDPVRSNLWLTCREQVIDTLHEACNQALACGKALVAWKGALIQALPKKPQARLVHQHRGIGMLCTGAKVLGRCLLAKIQEHVRLDITQFGAGPLKGVHWAAVTLTQVKAVIADRGSPAILLFIDIKAAFDGLIRDVLLKPKNYTTKRMLLEWGIEEKSAEQLLLDVATNPSVLVEHGVPEEYMRLTSDMFEGSWIKLKYGFGNAQLTTRRGTFQGHTYSGFLFAAYQQRATRRMRDKLHSMGALFSISVPTGGLGVVELPAPEVTLDPVLYHDDAFVALRADCIENL